MENRQIAKQFDLLAKLMELHEENPFKIRSYASAYQTIRRLDQDMTDMDEGAMLEVKGIGKAVASKIIEFIETGEISALEKIKSETPEGLIAILQMKGLGPKKVRLLWKELDITSLGELEYACLENRLLSLKGFGKKTQESILVQIEFIKKNAGQVLLSDAEKMGAKILNKLKLKFPDKLFELTGDLRRKMDSLSQLELVGTISTKEFEEAVISLDEIEKFDKGLLMNGLPLHYHESGQEEFGAILFSSTGPDEFTALFKLDRLKDEKEVFKQNNKSYIVPEQRDLLGGKNWSELPELMTLNDQKGVIHAHSTWSDGNNTIQQMVDSCKEEGYSYLVITDHSKSAFYANGLNEERILQQWKEIDEINAANPGFRVFKGIESDILYNGKLDYEDDLLSSFEVIIASIHSNLKMNEEKAHERLMGAIENPHTHILGHLTGRLLLSRPGYPVDHKRIIDACAANKVAIEINANPHRLDIDWRWLPYALDKGVKICISPDAHNTKGIKDMKYGVWMARKGGVGADQCLNTLDSHSFAQWAMK